MANDRRVIRVIPRRRELLLKRIVLIATVMVTLAEAAVIHLARLKSEAAIRVVITWSRLSWEGTAGASRATPRIAIAMIYGVRIVMIDKKMVIDAVAHGVTIGARARTVETVGSARKATPS